MAQKFIRSATVRDPKQMFSACPKKTETPLTSMGPSSEFTKGVSRRMSAVMGWGIFRKETLSTMDYKTYGEPIDNTNNRPAYRK
jgi:hypothetical protein